MKKEVLIEKANQLYNDVVANFPRIVGWQLQILEDISQIKIIPVREDFIGIAFINWVKETARGYGFVFFGIDIKKVALLFSAL